MRISSCPFVAFSVVLAAGSAGADTYVVNPDGTGDFPTIQEAIHAAEDGDVITLTDGTFVGYGNRDLDYLGKAITVRSQSGSPESCIIDCQGTEEDSHRAFLFQSGEQQGSILSGITIMNGWVDTEPQGGAILCQGGSSPSIGSCTIAGNRYSAVVSIGGSSPTFTDCVFSENEGRYGGAIYCQQSTITIRDCEFLQNTAAWIGGAYHAHAANAVITDCTFARNTAGAAGAVFLLYGADATLVDCLFLENSAQSAGAISLHGFGTGRFERCTFIGNSAVYGGAMETSKMSNAYLTQCTFWGNSSQNGGTVHCGETAVTFDNTVIAFSTNGQAINGESEITLTCCDLYGNAGGDWVGPIADQYGIRGNIAEDPLFCDAESLDLTLRSDSPCAEENNPECGRIGAWPVGCDVPTGVEVETMTWGAVKGRYR